MNEIRRRVCADCDHELNTGSTKIKVCPQCGSHELQTIRYIYCSKCHNHIRASEFTDTSHVDICEGI